MPEKTSREHHSRESRLQDLLTYINSVPRDTVLLQREIAEAVDIERSNVPGFVSELIERGAITRSGTWGKYTYKANRKYLNRGRPSGTKKAESPVATESNPEAEVAYLDTTEGLALNFMKETGSTNVAGFLKWLKTLFNIK